MREKLEEIRTRFERLDGLLSDSSVIADRKQYLEFSKERAELEPIVEGFGHWEKVIRELEESRALLEESNDDELCKLARYEIDSLKEQEQKLYSELLILLLPKDPNDSRNVILEIRAGAGGDEAAIFAGELFSAYVRYAEGRKWKVELMSASGSSVGGYKEVIAKIDGLGAYSALKYESGVHRVQRVPQTETQGRVHTSTVTVAVLPEADDVEVELNDKDLRIDVFRASGPGGQSVNTTDSAVRVTHLPTGLVVSCQDEKSQLKNKVKALTVLKARLYDMKLAEQQASIRDSRRSQIGTGDRSERIRTYNFPQGRVTDHRIGLTLYQIDSVMGGDLGSLIDPIIAHYRMEALNNQT